MTPYEKTLSEFKRADKRAHSCSGMPSYPAADRERNRLAVELAGYTFRELRRGEVEYRDGRYDGQLIFVMRNGDVRTILLSVETLVYWFDSECNQIPAIYAGNPIGDEPTTVNGRRLPFIKSDVSHVAGYRPHTEESGQRLKIRDGDSWSIYNFPVIDSKIGSGEANTE